jgi:hypothetical protein
MSNINQMASMLPISMSPKELQETQSVGLFSNMTESVWNTAWDLQPENTEEHITDTISTTMHKVDKEETKSWFIASCCTIYSFFVRLGKHKPRKTYTSMQNCLKNIGLC